MNILSSLREIIEGAAQEILDADVLLIGAGAGIGVDSGLPDFRGDTGFWKAYPPFKGVPFARMATAELFKTDPELAWGFYGHRRNLYRNTSPHSGFRRLLEWSMLNRIPSFVYTSNVDNQFLKACFSADRIVECHGSIEHLQCIDFGCDNGIWEAGIDNIEFDPNTFRASGKLPICPKCGGLARPNILMFDDWSWDSSRTGKQLLKFHEWNLSVANKRIVAIEIGAGTAIPSVRNMLQSFHVPLIRINPREAHGADYSIALGAKEGLNAIDQAMDRVARRLLQKRKEMR